MVKPNTVDTVLDELKLQRYSAYIKRLQQSEFISNSNKIESMEDRLTIGYF